MLAKLLKKKNKALLGVDISSTGVKVLELSEHNGRYQVEAYAREALPADAVVEQSINNDEAVGNALKKALSRARAGAKGAALAVSGSAVIVKKIKMNGALKEDEMDYQIRAEADQYIPYPLDEVALDWEVDSAPDSSGMVEVLLAACRLETVDRRKDVVEYAGLETRVVDIEVFCLERAYPLIAGQLSNRDAVETVAIVDIGANMTTLSVLDKGKSIYTREQLFGGKQLTQEITQRYGLNEEDAARAKVEGGLPDDYDSEVLEPFCRAVVQQVSRSLQFFYSSSQFNDVDYVVLAGGTAMLPNLADMVQEAVGIATVVANPFVSMTLSSKVNPSVLNNDAASLMVACGLALRSFD